jgi:iron-sulfur cluster assembly protein
MILLTERAANKVKQVIEKRGHGEGIRLGVRTTGCSGLAYVLEYVDCPTPDDQCIECQGCRLFVDPKSSVYLNGLTVDYVRQGLNEGFEFINPNERDRCGCGESFRV